MVVTEKSYSRRDGGEDNVLFIAWKLYCCQRGWECRLYLDLLKWCKESAVAPPLQVMECVWTWKMRHCCSKSGRGGRLNKLDINLIPKAVGMQWAEWTQRVYPEKKEERKENWNEKWHLRTSFLSLTLSLSLLHNPCSSRTNIYDCTLMIFGPWRGASETWRSSCQREQLPSNSTVLDEIRTETFELRAKLMQYSCAREMTIDLMIIILLNIIDLCYETMKWQDMRE